MSDAKDLTRRRDRGSEAHRQLTQNMADDELRLLHLVFSGPNQIAHFFYGGQPSRTLFRELLLLLRRLFLAPLLQWLDLPCLWRLSRRQVVLPSLDLLPRQQVALKDQLARP